MHAFPVTTQRFAAGALSALLASLLVACSTPPVETAPPDNTQPHTTAPETRPETVGPGSPPIEPPTVRPAPPPPPPSMVFPSNIRDWTPEQIRAAIANGMDVSDLLDAPAAGIPASRNDVRHPGHRSPSTPHRSAPRDADQNSDEIETAAGVEIPDPAAVRALDDYSVSVTANERLAVPGPEGRLTIWIGLTGNLPQPPAGMRSESRPLGYYGQSAEVIPFATGGLKITGDDASCARIVPSGSEFVYGLHPEKAGNYEVGAKVKLFDSADCSGTPVPKATQAVKVKITISAKRLASNAGNQLLGKAWDAFLEFWGVFLGLTFGLLLFLYRRLLARVFGYQPKDKEG